MATVCGPAPSAKRPFTVYVTKKTWSRGCLKQRKDCISRKNRAVTRQKSSEYLLYSEDFQRSKRRFLLGKTTFLIFQAAPGLPTYRTPRNGSLFRGAAWRKNSAFPPSCLRTGPAAPFAAHGGLRRSLRSTRLGTSPVGRRGVILNEKGVLHPFFKLFPRTLLLLLCLFR